jgi:hypothetical protein
MSKIAISFCLLFILVSPTHSQSADEYAIKASFIKKIMAFVDWELNIAETSISEPFVFGVIGDDPFQDRLRRVFSSVKIGGRKVEVKNISKLEGVEHCPLLYVSQSKRKEILQITEWSKENGILTVGDTEDYGKNGVIINFYIEDEQVRFEINARAARETGISINSLLLKDAKIVGGS